MEKSQKNITGTPAVLNTPAPDGKRLHTFTALPSSTVTILGPRRAPAVKAAVGNNDNSIHVFTSNGFQAMTNKDYIHTVRTLRPDIAIPMADINYDAGQTLQSRGLRKMAERTEDWVSAFCKSFDVEELQSYNTSIFAPTLPAPYPMQWEYLSRLSEDLPDRLSGLALYDVDIIPDLKNHPNLTPLPRLSLDIPPTPHHVLHQISLGADVFSLPFINTASDAGIALSFAFPPPPPSPTTTAAADNPAALLPLGIDMTHPAHQTSLAPLAEACACHACASHHRAYLHHLMNAREMLAWTLLQIHNHHAASGFFAGVRASLAAGTFEADRARFARAYEPRLPVGMGQRPRARGYHFKGDGGDDKRINKPAWGALGLAAS